MTEYQANLFEEEEARTVFDQLLAQSRVYSEGRSFRELQEFIAKMPQFAPFNAMLLHIQRPGLKFATTAHEWNRRFGRFPKESARPLLILWPFAPVVFVYDILDTQGPDLPDSVYTFYARGTIGAGEIATMIGHLDKGDVRVEEFEAGDQIAGSIQIVRVQLDKEMFAYRMKLNRNHPPPTKFVTLAHELAHLYLGHLGKDKARGFPDRTNLPHETKEIEAELVAYLVARRTGVESASQSYLSSFVTDEDVSHLELFRMLRAAGQVESVLGLTARLSIGAKTRARS